jgi:hypothetical protein
MGRRIVAFFTLQWQTEAAEFYLFKQYFFSFAQLLCYIVSPFFRTLHSTHVTPKCLMDSCLALRNSQNQNICYLENLE